MGNKLKFQFKVKVTETKLKELVKDTKKIKLILKVFMMDMIKHQMKYKLPMKTKIIIIQKILFNNKYLLIQNKLSSNA